MGLQSFSQAPHNPLITSIPTSQKRLQPSTKSFSLSTESQLQGRWQHGHLIVGYSLKAFMGADSHRASNVWARWLNGVTPVLTPINIYPPEIFNIKALLELTMHPISPYTLEIPHRLAPPSPLPKSRYIHTHTQGRIKGDIDLV